MANLQEIVEFCDDRSRRKFITDFPGAQNGIQVANRGQVTRIGAAVDAGLQPFRTAAKLGIDFLIVHHGMFWSPPLPVTGINHEKFAALFDHNIALYASHLPLDCHPEIGNNALLARGLNLHVVDWFLEYEGNPIAALATFEGHRDELRTRLANLFAREPVAIEFGSQKPHRIAILTGSGQSVLAHMRANDVDTLVTGELKQQHFNFAQENRLNLYLAGHYATETFGVQALARETAEKFGLSWQFINTSCPL